MLELPENAKRWGRRVNRRETGLIEHICFHGVGHPNYYSAQRLNQYADFYGNTWLIHGCDGCCSDPDFPGRKMIDLEIVERAMHEIQTQVEHDFSIEEENALWNWLCFTGHDMMVNGIDKQRELELEKDAMEAYDEVFG